MTRREEIVSGDEIRSILQLTLIIVALIVGRQVGGIYGSFNEVKAMTVVLDVSDEDLSGYLRDVARGVDADLRLTLGVTLPGTQIREGQVLQTPDYVRRLLVAATLSPILVQQPEVSGFEVTLLVEGEEVARDAFTFPREKVGYLSVLHREISVRIPDRQRFRELVAASAGSHSGEAEVTLRGRALAHLLWLDAWLPFESTRHAMVEPPSLTVMDHGWTSLTRPLQRLQVGESAYATVKLSNHARIYSLGGNLTCTIHRVGDDAPTSIQAKRLSVAPETEADYFFAFTPLLPGEYVYELSGSTGVRVDRGSARRLIVEP